MVDIRGFNGGLNTDSSPELLPNGDYTSAFNIENTAQGIVNILGNQPISSNIISLIGNDWMCGAFFDKRRQRIYYFTNNSFGKHRILSHSVTSGQTRELFIDSIYQPGESGAARYVWFKKEGNLNIIEIEGAIITDLRVGGTITFAAAEDNNGTFNITAIEYLENKTRLNVSSDVVTDSRNVLITYPIYGNESAVLGWPISLVFNPNLLIKDLKVIHREIEGDLVYFIDPNKRLLKFNQRTLSLKKYGTDFTTYKLDYFLVIKAPPKEIASVDIVDEEENKINNLYRKLFQFKYRYVYDDNEKSVWSALSKVPIPNKSTDPDYNSLGNKQNCIEVKVNTGDINVSKIEIAARVNIESEWSDFFLVDTLDKFKLNISSQEIYNFKFRNDSVYTPIDIQESNLLFDYVPEKNNAFELANGNTIVVGGLTDGYPRDISLNVFAVSVHNNQFPVQASTLTSEVRNSIDNGPFVGPVTINPDFNDVVGYRVAGMIKFTGVPQVGDTIKISLSGRNTERWEDLGGVQFTNRDFNQSWSVVFRSGWGIVDLINWFVQNANSPSFNVNGQFADPTRPFGLIDSPAQNTLYFGFWPIQFAGDQRKYVFNSASVEIKKAYTFTDNDVIPTLRWSARYKYGLVYYDKNGKTNGVFTTSPNQLGFDNFSVNTARYRYFQIGDTWIPKNPITDIEIKHTPPSWAEYYHIVRTKDLSADFSLMVICVNLINEGSFTFLDINNIVKTNTDSPETSLIINYSKETFVPGDRVRILWNEIKEQDFGDYIETEILGVVDKGPENNKKRYLKIKKLTVNNPYYGINGRYIIEIYRPAKVMSEEDLTFYEIGEKYNIIKSGNNIYHQGNVRNQGEELSPNDGAIISIFNDGDYYYKIRTMDFNRGDGTPTYNSIYVADKNFSETYLSAVWGQGRPLVVDENAKLEYYPAMLRFSQSYIYGTNINNTNRFYPNNFEEADASFGDILRLKTRENFIRMFQRHKVGMIPIYRQIIIDNAQSSQVALSERLLNKPNYYSGEYGIDKYGSSLVSTDYGDYFIDTINKCIVRVSLDGLTNVSDTNNLMTWSNGNIFEESYGYGCFNYENRNVIILVGRNTRTDGIITGVQNQIVAYNEPNKKFESYYGYSSAENILFINGLIYTGYQGRLFIHNNPVRNNFFGSQQNSLIGTVFNGNVQLKKTYTAIEELASSLWTANIVTGPLTNQFTDITAEDFKKTVGAYVINSKENKFNATIKRSGFGIDKYFGVPMKGLYAQVSLTNSLTTEQRLISVSLKYITSPLTNS
jgi:hypothetical protein